MILECVQPFGNFKPGEILEVADGSVFDTLYFREAPEGAEVADAPYPDEPVGEFPLYPKGK